MNEAAILAIGAGVDRHVTDGPIFATKPRLTAANRFVTLETAEHIEYDGLIYKELDDVMADIFVVGIAQQPQLGLVGPKDGPVLFQPTQRNGSVLDEIPKLAFPVLNIAYRRSSAMVLYWMALRRC